MASSDSSTWTVYGLYDGPCPTTRLSPYDSKLGGYPDFFATCLLTSAPLCSLCHSSLVLVAQIYCPLEDSPFHRLLHVFSCTEKKCWSSSESWLLLRSQSLDLSYSSNGQQKKESKEEDVEETHETMAEDWCSGADDWLDDIPNSCEEEDSDKESHDVPDEIFHDQPNVKKSHDLPGVNNVPNTNGSCDQPSKSHDLCTTLCMQDSESDETISVHEVSSGTGNTHHHPYTGPAYPSGYIRVTHSWDNGRCDGSEEDKVKDLLQRYSVENPDCLTLNTRQASNSRLTSNHGGGCSKGGEKKRGKGRDLRANASIGAGETYEKVVARHGDVAFMKFQKALAKFPQQLLRYCWKGEAIHMTQTDEATRVEACPACGAERVYECQLMPQAVYFLHRGRGSDHHRDDNTEDPPRPKDAVEFGTVIIYTCSKSCWNQDPVKNKNCPQSQDQNQDQTSSKNRIEDDHLDKFKQELILIQTE